MITNKLMLTEDTKPLARKVQNRELLKKHPPSIKFAYKTYEQEHYLRGIPGKPVSLATFYRLWNDIPEEEKILAQRGRKAASEYTRAKLGRAQRLGFHASAQVDALHEPIKLLSSWDFKPLPYKPIHHFVLETESTVVMGFATNYETGSERAEYSIEANKMAFLPKTGIQETWGTTNSWPVYGKTFEITLDAGTAYNNTDYDTFLSMCYTSSKVTRSRKPYEKELVEAFNKVVKEGFTVHLDGAYDDKAPKSEQEKIVAVYTELEHKVLFHRFIVDKYHQAINNKAYHGLSRIDHWRREAERQPPVLPLNPQAIVNFLGIEHKKTIMDKVGIQITVLGEKYIYNSHRLQKIGRILRKNIVDKAKRRVSLKWSITEPDFIFVREPGTNDVFKVDRISNDRGDTDLVRQFEFNLDPMFYETQDLDVLSRMSNAEIHAHAKLRHRAIMNHKKHARRDRGRKSIPLNVAIDRSKERLMAITKRANVGANKNAEEQSLSTPNLDDFSPGHAADLDWDGAAQGGGDE